MSDTSKPADPYLSREAWIKTVRPLYARRGEAGLDTLPTRPAVTVKDHDVARQQMTAITRKSFSMPEGYERIQWGRKESRTDGNP